MEVKRIKMPILEKKLIAEKTYEVSFDLEGKEFEFLAGQFIRVNLLKLLYPDNKGKSRLFSIASSPNNKKKLTIAFRDSQSGFKKTLLELPIGSSVMIEGPFGYLTLPDNKSERLVFIAGGIGIAPFLSMIYFIIEEKLDYEIVLLYANWKPETAAYLKELTYLSETHSNFTLKNKFGYIDEYFIKESVKNLNDYIWYIVGLPEMVSSVRDLLFRLGVNSSRIHYENFTGY